MKNILILENMPIVVRGIKSLLQEFGWEGYNIDVSESFNELTKKLETKYYKLIIICLQIQKFMLLDEFLNIVTLYGSSNFLIFIEDTEQLPAQKLYHTGVKGILDKRATEREIIEAISTMMESKIYTTTPTLFKLVKVASKPTFSCLTKREMDVAQLLLDGQTNKQIGEKLALRPSTVSTFKNKIFYKMRVANIIELKMIENDGFDEDEN